jgi:hypothetical protein
MTRKEFFDSVVPQMLAQILGDALTTTVNGLAQVTSALYSYESQIYTPRRRPLLYQRLVPIDTSDGEGAIGRAYFTMEYRGDTKEIARGSDDMPLVDVTGAANYIPFKIGGEGYTYDTEDIRQAALLNFNRIALMPLAAFNVYERAINEHVLFGDTRGGKLNFKEALFTSPQIHVEEVDRPLNWDSPIEDLIAAFLSPLDTVYERSLGTSWANVICVPSRLIDLTEIKPLNDLSIDTILTWVRRVNKTTQETGEPLMIVGVPGLETAGANGGPRIMAYELNPENLVLPLPMPFRFIAPQIRNLTFVVPGEYKYGPVHFRYPKSAVYYDYPVESNLFTSRRRDLLAGAKGRRELPHPAERELPQPVEPVKEPRSTQQEPAHARKESR